MELEDLNNTDNNSDNNNSQKEQSNKKQKSKSINDSTKRTKNKTNKKKITLVIVAICLIAAAVIGGIYVAEFLIKKSSVDAMKELSDKANKTTSKATKKETSKSDDPKEYTLDEKYQYFKDKYGIDVPRKNLNFSDMQANTNSDIFAWLYVPNTNIDYPVLQCASDSDYYLHHNLDGSGPYPGCLYTDNVINKDLSDRLIAIYGHNNPNGIMFAQLHKYEKQDFMDKNRYFFVYLPNDIKVYKVFTAHTGLSINLVTGYDLTDDSTYTTFLKEIWKDNTYNDLTHEEDTNFSPDVNTMVLSTCIYPSTYTERYLVFGEEVNGNW